ncbi:hypothetical protein CHS0354_006941 [Potamilus streckersoni]|uniref:Tr-type G domain-containing protein n=1 Tax=Potamilus streckersoni TaxID=2493646 RepID=A0AAE0TEF9_9BIVA|nr:hypothetical protein CHS0354_006941 [Potamilus streckersoni]
MTDIRNIAIIAHVDHGKTTLVDRIIKYCAQFKEGAETDSADVLDNNDLERERGITIVSKNLAVEFNSVKINIIDTPGHADFGGEVERVLNMADGVLLLVDAFEGPMPQTRYVLSKAIELGKKPIVVINKVDKPNCDPQKSYEMVFDLMCNLNATEDQLDFPVVYGSAKHGWMSLDYKQPATDLSALLEMVVKHIPVPKVSEGSVQMQIASLEYSKYLGRIAVGRIYRGEISEGSMYGLVKRNGSVEKFKVKDIFVYENLGKRKVKSVQAGDICAVSGMEDFEIGETIADADNPVGLPTIPIDEPTMSMLFTINNSPLFGRDGKLLTSRHLRERLMLEMRKNLALRVEEVGSDSFLVYGRGVMHLSVLIETMRREGYELQVGQPQVITKVVNGVKQEPVETLYIDTPEGNAGKVIEAVSLRKGNMLVMEPKGDFTHMEFEIPSRGIIGLRTSILNITGGEVVFAHRFKEYQEWKGAVPSRINGVLIAHEPGFSNAYALFHLEDRGRFFIGDGEEVYEGMIVGEHTRDNDLIVNVNKTKKLTNMRASGSDEKIRLTPPLEMSLEEYMEYIQEDEYVEITPKVLRLRKIHLKEHERKQ